MATEAVGIAQAPGPAAPSHPSVRFRAATTRDGGLQPPHYYKTGFSLASPRDASLARTKGRPPRASSTTGAAEGLALESAQTARRGGQPMGNSEWKSKTQQVREKVVRDKKLKALYGLQDRMRILTERIEVLEDELDLLGWKPRVYPAKYKTPYRQELINELCALPEKDRARRVRKLAAQEGIDPKSVYRKLQKCVRWVLRAREDPAWESKSNAVLSKRAALSDLG